MVISSKNFWNQTQEALNVKKLADYNGAEANGSPHYSRPNLCTNNFLQFVTTEKIGREKFDFVLDIEPNSNQQQSGGNNNNNNNHNNKQQQTQQPKPQQQNNDNNSNNNNNNKNHNKTTTTAQTKQQHQGKKKSYLKPILIGCCGILVACLVSIPVIGPMIEQYIKDRKTKVNINK